MPIKQKKMGPYATFVQEQKRVVPGWSGKSAAELFKLADPLWQRLTEGQRQEYITKAKRGGSPATAATTINNNNHINNKVNVGGYDAIGRPLDDIKKRDQRRADDVIDGRVTTRRLVEEARSRGALETTEFIVIHCNIFCRTVEDGETVPAEVALARFSIKDGLIDSYHVFTEPGIIPSGYKHECMARSDRTHKIPIYDDDPRIHRDSAEEIIKAVRKFMAGGNTWSAAVRTHVFSMPGLEEDCLGVLDQLVTRLEAKNSADQTRAKFDEGLKVLHLTDLLANFIENIPSSVAESILEQQMFMYQLSCAWHLETESRHCSLAYVKRWIFTILQWTNNKFRVDVKEGRHIPSPSRVEDAAEVSTWVEDRAERPAHDVKSGFASSDIRYRGQEDAAARSTQGPADDESLESLMASTFISSLDDHYVVEESVELSHLTSARSSIMSSASANPQRESLLQSIRHQRIV